MVAAALVVSIIAAIAAVGAWVAAVQANGRATYANTLSREANREAEKANTTSTKALTVSEQGLDVAREANDRTLDTVDFAPTWSAPGLLVCTNTSRKNTAKSARLRAAVTSVSPDAPTWEYQSEFEIDVRPGEGLTAVFAPVTPDMVWALGLTDGLYFLEYTITWTSDRGWPDRTRGSMVVAIDLP